MLHGVSVALGSPAAGTVHLAYLTAPRAFDKKNLSRSVSADRRGTPQQTLTESEDEPSDASQPYHDEPQRNLAQLGDHLSRDRLAALVQARFNLAVSFNDLRAPHVLQR